MTVQNFWDSYTGFAQFNIYNHVFDSKANNMKWELVHHSMANPVKWYHREILNWYFILDEDEDFRIFIVKVYLKDEEHDNEHI